MTTNIERIQIADAKEQNIELNDYYGFFAAMTSAGDIVGPIILAALVGIGYSALGFVWAAVMAVCLLVYTILIRKQRSTPAL